jgi:PAS domain S-box-containing protein
MESHLKRLNDLICVWTPDGVLSSCNDAYCQFIGTSRSELIGRRWNDLLPSQYRSSAADFLEGFLANPSPFRREQAARHASGELRWIDWISQPIHDSDGKLRQVLSEGRDVTERKRAEEAARESERRYRLLFEDAIEGMVLADVESGVIEDCNHAFLRLTGYERADLLGKPLPLGDPRAALAFPSRLAALRDDGRTLPARLLSKAGGVRDVSIKGSIVQFDGRQLVHAFIQDVTQERLAERFRDASLVLLRLLNQHDQTRELLRQLTELLRVWSGCEAIAVRLREGEDFPFYETRGLPTEFVRTGRSLCRYDTAGRLALDEAGNPVMECLCGQVVSGQLDTSLGCCSRRGSFWTNSLSSVSAAIQPTRARCLQEGFESMALIPLRHGDEVLGMLQISDRAPGRFSEALIDFLEHAGEQIAISLAQKAKLSSLEGGLRQIAALIAEIGVGARDSPRMPPALRTALSSLSRRETEVLRLLLMNRRPTTIARELSRSVHTVRNQLKAIFRKLDVHSQEELLNRLGPNPGLLARSPDRPAPATPAGVKGERARPATRRDVR